MTDHTRSDQGNWKCECGAECEPYSAKWRWSGHSWQHHHGYPIGHVDAIYTEPPPRESCEWKEDESEYSWDGACGAKWQFMEGGPAENDMRFCPQCGGRLTIKPQTRTEDEDNE